MTEDGSSDEEFEDAATTLQTKLFDTDGYSQEVSKGLEVLQNAVKLVITNRYVEAEAILRDKAKDSLYHGVGYALIVFIQAALSFDRESIERTHTNIQQALELCNKHRRTTNMWGTLSGMWYGKRLDGYSVVELHAEVFYAECSLLEALLTFLQDESLMSFIRAGLKIRNCHSMFKQCHSWLEEVNTTSSQQSATSPAVIDKHFVSGVHLGVGVFNVVISLLPGRILRLLEFVGFSGDRILGMRLLTSGYHSNTCHSPLCSMSLLGYYCVIAPYTGFGAYEDLSIPSDILRVQLTEFPNSGVLLFFSGRLALLQGKVDEAIAKFLRSIEEMSQWKKIHVIAYWELMYCYCFLGNWRAAAYYADLLYNNSRWSKVFSCHLALVLSQYQKQTIFLNRSLCQATFLYQKAAFLLMAKRGEKNNPPVVGNDVPSFDATDDEIIEMMKKVPTLKQRIAGRSLPIEKFAINKAERYLQGEAIPLCGLEMVFAWNGFAVLEKAQHLAKLHLATVWECVTSTVEAKAGNNGPTDDHCVISLMQGLCFKSVGRMEEATRCFEDVTASAARLQHDHYTPPAACWQLGLLLMEEGKYDLASKKLEAAKSQYKGYTFENRIHFRVHAALSAIEKQRSHK